MAFMRTNLVLAKRLNSFTQFRPILLPIVRFCSKKDLYNDKPIVYSKSPAIEWKAQASRTGIVTPRLWYEPYVVILSVAVFMFYFCVLREENDVDLEFTKSLYSRVNGLEEQQLRLALKYNQDKGLPIDEIMNRLSEIEQEKQNASSNV